jgi:RES domain-containing protein
MPTLYRIVKAKYSAQAFDGEGARLNGGRWNRPGSRVVYTSATASLATLEILVHVKERNLLRHYLLIPAECPNSLVLRLEDLASLPADWRDHPPLPETQAIGEDWLARQASAVLSVPSVVIPSERNYLINPGHRDFKKIKLGAAEAFEFDPRLIA